MLASLLEMMVDSSLSDLRVAQGVALPFCPSLVRLLRLLQDFLFAEGNDNHSLWSEKVPNENDCVRLNEMHKSCINPASTGRTCCACWIYSAMSGLWSPVEPSPVAV